MISHEEARRKPIYYDMTQKLIDSDFYYGYITEQEKKDELLGLYRKLYDTPSASKYLKRDIVVKIILIEEELK